MHGVGIVVTRTRALEAYWSGFIGWLFAALDRRWFGSVVRNRLRAAALDVGEALIAVRTRAHGADAAAIAALDRFAWLVGIAAGLRELDAAEAERARYATAVVTKMLARAPVEPAVAPARPSAQSTSPSTLPSALPSTSPSTPRSSPRIRARSSAPAPAHHTLVPVTPTAG